MTKAHTDTFHALATPSGTSALAVIRVTGPGVRKIVREALRRDPLPVDDRRAVLGRYDSLSGDRIDQVIYTFYPGQASYTGRDLLEISSHGNMFLVEQILADLQSRGSRLAEPGEFTRTAFLEGKMDLSQAEAVGDLIAAKSTAAAEAARLQLEGGLGEEIDEVVQQVLALQAHIEAFIDFPEEDLPAETAEGPLRSMDRIIARLDEMIATGHPREILERGVRCGLLGAVNAGKSSLLNRLLGENRAIVSETPGTTRDYLQGSMQIGPYCIQIYDTAGYRDTVDPIEEAGLQRTDEVAVRMDLLVLVIDGTAPSPALPDSLTSRLTEFNALLVLNKSDLAGFSPDPDFLPSLSRVEVSARTGEGVPAFRKTLESMIRIEILQSVESRILYNRRHIGHLTDCRTALLRARLIVEERASTEYAAQDVRDALNALGAIVGTIDNEAMLDVLFGDFCIGK